MRARCCSESTRIDDVHQLHGVPQVPAAYLHRDGGEELEWVVARCPHLLLALHDDLRYELAVQYVGNVHQESGRPDKYLTRVQVHHHYHHDAPLSHHNLDHSAARAAQTNQLSKHHLLCHLYLCHLRLLTHLPRVDCDHLERLEDV